MIGYIDRPEIKTVELVIDGKIDEKDYDEVHMHLEQSIEEWGEVNIVENILDLKSVSLGAFWKNIGFARRHFKHISRMAVVTNDKWIRRFSEWVMPFTPFALRPFYRTELEYARAWAKTDTVVVGLYSRTTSSGIALCSPDSIYSSPDSTKRRLKIYRYKFFVGLKKI